MTADMLDLARRAVACKGWRWMPGMRTTDGMRTIHDPGLWPDRPCAIREGTWVDTAVPRPLGDHLPDLTDPATLGCLLALVREAWRYPTAHPMPWGRSKFRPEPTGWAMLIGADDTLPNATLSAPTEAEALIAALEAAPCST
jgi:hypothetical protein